MITHSGSTQRVRPSVCRRAFYRVPAMLPVRVTPLAEEDVEKACFESTWVSAEPEPEPVPTDQLALFERLDRIEEKLDRLLGLDAPAEAEEGPGLDDVERVVFSGSGLSLAYDDVFEVGDAFRVELALPGGRALRAVARAVRAPKPLAEGVARFELPLAFEFIADADRDALVAYNYELQRLELRARDAAGSRSGRRGT